MSSAPGILVVSAKEATQLLGPRTSRACSLGASDATLPQPQAISRVSRARRREPTRLGCDGVASSIQAPGQLSIAGCGLLSEATP